MSARGNLMNNPAISSCVTFYGNHRITAEERDSFMTDYQIVQTKDIHWSALNDVLLLSTTFSYCTMNKINDLQMMPALYEYVRPRLPVIISPLANFEVAKRLAFWASYYVTFKCFLKVQGVTHIPEKNAVSLDTDYFQKFPRVLESHQYFVQNYQFCYLQMEMQFKVCNTTWFKEGVATVDLPSFISESSEEEEGMNASSPISR